MSTSTLPAASRRTSDVATLRSLEPGNPPLELHLIPAASSWSNCVYAATWGFVVLGVVLRVARYLLHFPLWGDEAMLAVNFLDRGYRQLLQPLEHCQIGPPLFLWIELTVVKLLGFNELSLRLFPQLCGLASVLLFRHFVGRLLSGVPLLLAVAVFSVAYYPIRFAAEVKPYAGDLFVALILLTLAVEWRRAPQQRAWLWSLAAATPLCLALSFPAVFVAGGVCAALFPLVWAGRDRRTWLAFAACHLALAATFAALYFAFLRPHHQAFTAAGIMRHWTNGFPPLTEPRQLLTWFVQVHTSHMMAYPVGAERGGSSLTTLLCLAACGLLLWRRRLDVLALCLMPFPLALVAAALRKYPYGDTVRTMQFLAPAICLLAGLGACTVIAWCRRETTRRRLAVVCLGGLLAIGVGGLTRDLLRPYKTPYDQCHREFARWLWTDGAYHAELVCASADFASDCRYQPCRDLAPEYRCYQTIYSPRHHRGEAHQPDRIGADHPLRVVFSCASEKVDCGKATREQWLEQTVSRQRLRPISVQRYRLNAGQDMYDRVYEVHELVPWESVSNQSTAAGASASPPY